MTELYVCPFCGSRAVMETFTTAAEKVPRYRVRCTGEKCPIDSGWDWFDPEELAKWWNTRASVTKKEEDTTE